jgi:hypothetical protein
MPIAKVPVLLFNTETRVSTPVTSRGGRWREVVDWYARQCVNIARFYDLENVKVRFDDDDEVIVISYEFKPGFEDDPNVISDILSDPDDDGNEPIVIGDETFLVIGEI